MLNIDMHTHTVCPDVDGLVKGKRDPLATPYRRDMSPESHATNQGLQKSYQPMLADLARRRVDMERCGIDVQVIAPAPAQQNYWADEDLLVALSRAQNDHVARMVADDPAHFVGLGTLPMRFPDRAVEEATRAVEELGLRGFQIDTRVNDVELSDTAFAPIWSRIEMLGVPLFIHPLGFSHSQRLGPFFMVNSVGQPLEELIAAMHLISGGVLDRHPDLKVVIAHGGGYLPFYIGRLDHTWKVRPEVRTLTPNPPSAYIPRLWFDTCVFRSDDLERLVEIAGPDKVMLGSDYPFDMADEDPVATVRACQNLDDSAARAILSGNAARLFGIEAAG